MSIQFSTLCSKLPIPFQADSLSTPLSIFRTTRRKKDSTLSLYPSSSPSLWLLASVGIGLKMPNTLLGSASTF